MRIYDENDSYYQLCCRKSLRELLLELLTTQNNFPKALHLLIALLYGNGRMPLKLGSTYSFATCRQRGILMLCSSSVVLISKSS